MPTPPDVCKLTPDLADRLILLIERGNYITVACTAVGITEMTYYNWLAWGEDENRDPIYSQFRGRALAATATAETKALNSWVNAFDGDWKAAQKFLAIRFRDRWGEAKEQPQPLDTTDDKLNSVPLNELLGTIELPRPEEGKGTPQAAGDGHTGGVRPDCIERTVATCPAPGPDQPQAD